MRDVLLSTSFACVMLKGNIDRRLPLLGDSLLGTKGVLASPFVGAAILGPFLTLSSRVMVLDGVYSLCLCYKLDGNIDRRFPLFGDSLQEQREYWYSFRGSNYTCVMFHSLLESYCVP